MVDVRMEFDPEDIARAMGVDEDEVLEMMKDGRYAAPWMERRIRHEFELDDPEGDEDAVSEEGPVEFKGITKYGVKLVPSKMVGYGRSVDWDALNEWLESMSGGFIVHDNTEFPSVPCWWINPEIVKEWVEDGEFNADGGMSYNKIIGLLG
jgi:hypothetical protein